MKVAAWNPPQGRRIAIEAHSAVRHARHVIGPQGQIHGLLLGDLAASHDISA
ncbi:MAG TPA: hypothetical protein VE645_19120 [Pseudonocardiaceae bacterium]|nr:hypothetical protein [Pseudonocardiaceae bacterium]